MPITLHMMLDKAAFDYAAKQRGNEWAKGLSRTMSDMARRAPAKVSKIGAETYNIAATRLNPRNKKAKGSVSVAGGLKTFTLVYSGPKLPVTDFKGVRPRGPRKRPYTITGEIVKGQGSQLGHWNLPRSEGGRYAANSPWMNVPGVPGPVMRIGSKLGNTMRALAVPQMVVSDRSEDRVVKTLNDLMAERLYHNLAGLL